ncbi:MAG: flagellar basal body L-ring protein FlgH [Chitinispirillales bacterium]|jgi:flagellar L-ring protein precursor FlgH|nr:flagellar basal body L-ring protein FlgH [Chitinispirillales bacterium]
MNLRLKTVLLSVAAAAAFSAAWAVPMHSLFSDHRAMRVNDILTIHIVESAKAGTESNTNTDKSNSAEVGVPTVNNSRFSRWLPTFGVKSNNSTKFDGKGSTNRKGSFEATVSARVVEVLEGGNLVIEGSKVVEVNQEKEVIKISGIVRPQDIQKNNIVFSSSIADAQITYSGNGVAATASRAGIFTRFFNWIF